MDALCKDTQQLLLKRVIYTLLLIKCIWLYFLLEEVMAFSEFRAIYKHIKCVYLRSCKVDKFDEFKCITRRFLFYQEEVWNKIGREQAIKLGLLMNADEDVQDCDWLTCQHKMLQVNSQTSINTYTACLTL